MKGVVIEKAGAEPEVTDSLEKPKPSSDQILVKSIYMAINPVYALASLPQEITTDRLQRFLHDQFWFARDCLAVRIWL